MKRYIKAANYTISILVFTLVMAKTDKLTGQILGFDSFNDFLKESPLYVDLTFTPLMAYTLSSRKSNVPTHFLVANGVKANIGGEIGLLLPVFSPRPDADGYFTAGYSYHFLGFDYGGRSISLAKYQSSNITHHRVFMGAKLIPFNNAQFFSLSITAGHGKLYTNEKLLNTNGRLKAAVSDVSISFSVGLNRFVL